MSDDEQEGQVFLDDFGALTRANFGLNTERDRLISTDTDKFTSKVDAILADLTENYPSIFNKENIKSKIIDSIPKLSIVERKNPTGYILGYMIVKNGKISENSYSQIVTSVLPNVKESYIRKPDLLRYGRWWLNNV